MSQGRDVSVELSGRGDEDADTNGSGGVYEVVGGAGNATSRDKALGGLPRLGSVSSQPQRTFL